MNYNKPNLMTFSAASMNSYDMGLRAYMVAVYKYMSIALGITGAVAFAVSSSPGLMAALFSGPMMWLVVLAPFAMAVFMSARFMYMSADSAKISLWAYSGLMGVSMASLFFVYTGESIAKTFFITSSVFAAMSLYGYTTKKDLATFSSFFMMGLFGIVIASLVNVFMQSSAISFVVSLIGVAVFSFMTAYETQRLKSIYYQVANDASVAEKVAVFGALGLYMDFVNLFMSLLHFFGDRRS